MAIINSSIRKVVQESSGGGVQANTDLIHFLSKSAPASLEITADYFGDRTKVYEYEFYQNKSIASVALPNAITSIFSDAFSGCSMSSITLGSGLTTINSFAFYLCTNLTSLTIPDSVSSIGGNMCDGCTSLTSVTIGSGVDSIPNYSFSGCSGGLVLTLNKPSVVILTNSFALSGCGSNFQIRVPANLVDAYKAATNWSASWISSQIVAIE